MSDRCDGVRQAKVSSGYAEPEPRTSEPAKEDAEANRMRRDREADARQSAWISCGDHDAGMSKAGMSVRGTAPNASTATQGDYQRRKAEETRRLDPPLRHDPIGNAIPGLIVGGLVAGLEAGATGAGLGHTAGSIAKHSALHVAAEGVEHGAHAVVPGGHSPAPPAPPASAAAEPKRSEPTAAAAAGRSSSKATSETAPAPNKSESPPLRGQDRVPWRPGEAPFRVPEAPHAASTMTSVMIRG
jgi:hypothetical protein